MIEVTLWCVKLQYANELDFDWLKLLYANELDFDWLKPPPPVFYANEMRTRPMRTRHMRTELGTNWSCIKVNLNGLVYK